jgi:hypothetical protein
LCRDALDTVIANLAVQSLEPHLPRVFRLVSVPQLFGEGSTHPNSPFELAIQFYQI